MRFRMSTLNNKRNFPMDDAAAIEVMKQFGKAFFKKDSALLAAAITEDAEWHQDSGPDAPHGRVLKGVKGFLQGIVDKEGRYESQRFNDVVIKAMGEDQIVMTYLLEGKSKDGREFSARGIELLTVRDGRICKKDVFLKQLRE